MDHILYIHLCVNERVGCFYLLATVNYAAVSMCVRVFVRAPVFSSFGCVPRCGMAGSHVNPRFNSCPLPLGLDRPPGGSSTGTVSVGSARSHLSSMWNWLSREGPAAQLSRCLPSGGSLAVMRKAHMGSMSGCIGMEGGSRHKASPGRSGVCSAHPPAGSLLGEKPLVSGVCLSSLFGCRAKGGGRCESVAVAAWKLQVTSRGQSRRPWMTPTSQARS